MLRSCFISFLLATTLLSYSQGDSANAERASRKVVIPKFERTKGYVGWVEAGVNFLPVQGNNHSTIFPSPVLLIFNGARINRNITLGLELGIHATTHYSVNAKVRYNLFLKPRIALFFDFSAGYAFTFINDNGHGFNFSPSVGFKVWGKKGKAAFTFRVGYNGLVTKEMYHINTPWGIAGYPDEKKRFYYYSGVYATIGVEF